MTLRVSVCGGRFEQLGLSQCTINTTDPTATPTIMFTARTRARAANNTSQQQGPAGAAGATCSCDGGV